MSSWEERMADAYRRRKVAEVAAARKAYLGEAFLEFYPPDDDAFRWGFELQVEILPEVIAARCLGLSYGDPGPKLPDGTCRQCWGERHAWLGNCWGLQHTGEPGSFPGCRHECHEGETWTA